MWFTFEGSRGRDGNGVGWKAGCGVRWRVSRVGGVSQSCQVRRVRVGEGGFTFGDMRWRVRGGVGREVGVGGGGMRGGRGRISSTSAGEGSRVIACR